MTDRGSFVTEPVDCEMCWSALKSLLVFDPGKPRWLNVRGSTITVPAFGDLPIIAGHISGLGSREELLMFEVVVAPAICAAICHPIRVAVLAERGECVFLLNPSRDEDSAEVSVCESRGFSDFA